MSSTPKSRFTARAGSRPRSTTCKAKGLIYEGVLEPPKGKKPEDWEPRVQTLFKSTEYGDDVDRPVMKSDGAWTYFAPDIAYHYDKVSRGFDALIDIFGADHGGYVKRMKAAVAALSEERVPLDIKLMQLVKLKRGDEELKMSKRAGTFVTLRDVVEMVGPDVTRFVMLTRKNDAPLDFDVDKVREQSKDNPSSTCNTRMRGSARSCARRRRRAWISPCPMTFRPSLIRRNSASSPSSLNGRVWWRLPRRDTSPTGSRSTFMTWRQSSMRCGTGAMPSPSFASSRKRTRRRPAPNSH
jgi:hypothetical protein